MTRRIKIYLFGLKNALSSRTAYRTDFFVSFAIMLIAEFVIPFVTIIIYKNGLTFAGWSLYEVLLIQATFMLTKGIAFPFFFVIVWNTIIKIRSGTFDILLLRPSSTLFMLMVTGINVEDFGKLAGGIFFFIFVTNNVPIQGAFAWITFSPLLCLSLLILFSFALIMSALTIKMVETTRLYEIFDSAVQFGSYPIKIFPQFIQTIILTIVPVSLTGFIPAGTLLNKNFNFNIIYPLLSGILFCICAFVFWKHMVKQYCSAGG